MKRLRVVFRKKEKEEKKQTEETGFSLGGWEERRVKGKKQEL